jgi:isochorismate synthase
MRIYWSDRENHPAPPHSTFHFYPFSGGKKLVIADRVCTLPAPTSAKILKRSFSPSKDQWFQLVDKAKKLIFEKNLHKVVLARKCTLVLDHAPNPFAITAALKDKALGAFVFCAQMKDFAFLGASPERLFIRKGKDLTAEALAGTRKRGNTASEDESLKNELLTSAKDLHEFSFIPEHLQTVLSPFCEAPLHFSPISVHQTKNVQHLYCQGKALLKIAIADEEIAAKLHPTPALCGAPHKKALRFIQENEPFDRGLYGGVIGWSRPDASEWVVAIRSCQIQANIAHLFSGTGIVAQSDPEKEWDELNQKVKLYESILDY